MLFPVWSVGSTNPHNNAEDAAFDGKEHDFDVKKPESNVILSPSSSAQSKEHDDKTKNEAKGKSHIESVIRYRDLNAEFQHCSKNSSNEVNAASSIVPTVRQNYLNSINTFSAAGPSNTVADFKNLEFSIPFSPIPTKRIHKDHTVSKIIGDLSSTTQTRRGTQEVDLPYGKRAIGTKWVYRNKKDERGIVIKNKARLVAQGHTQEEGIYYKEVFPLVARIKAIRLFLAYASFMGFMVYQMDVKSAFLYGTIEEEVYVCQPLGFKEPDHLDKLYKVVKALYDLHQAPRAWLTEGKSASTPIDIEKPLLKDLDEKKAEEAKVASDDQVKGREAEIYQIDMDHASKVLKVVTAASVSVTFASITIVAVEPQVPAATITAASSNDVTRIQALVDKKKVVIMEATIRDALRLGNAEGVDCLPNEEIFAELACMGFEKPSTKLTSYKAFFSSQWKFLIYTILQSLSAKRTSWNEFSSVMASAVICLSTAQALEITKLKRKVKKLERGNKVKVLKLRRLKKVGTSQRIDSSNDTVMEDASNQGRMIDILDKDDAVVLMDDKHAEKKAKEAMVTCDDQEDKPEVHEVVDVVTTDKLITKVVTAASESVPAATITAAPVRLAAASTRRRKRVVIKDPEEESTTIIPDDTKFKDKGKGIMVEEPKPLKKKQQVEMDAEYARKLHEELNKDIDWNVSIDHVKKKAKEDPFTKEQLEDEENRAIQSINETPAQKAVKKKKLNEEVEDLK
nr:putative ribonuclease H-like domain-containing protein [Tanacetum cinerariifolium]